MKKLLLAATLLATSGMTQASDLEWNFAFGANAVPVQELIFAYNSQSVVTDSDNDGVLSNGDAIHSFGGYGANGFDALVGSPLTGQGYDSLSENLITGFNPDLPAPAGYKSNYVFTFLFNDLMGTWQNNDFVYTSGTIQFGVYTFNAFTGFAANTFHSLFDMDLAFGGPGNVGGQQKQVFKGMVTPASLANGAGSDFTLTEGSKTQSFTDWINDGYDININSNQTVDAGFVGFEPTSASISFGNPGDSTIIAANHTGRLNLEVPEPSTLAIFGLSLLGFAAAGRRKAK